MKKETNLNPKACKECGGKCCNGLPGGAAPEDFGTTKKQIEANVRKALLSGEWQLDCWEGEAEFSPGKTAHSPHFVRPKCLDGRREDRVFSYTWGGPCVFLTPKGCRLKPTKRPFECRMLVPPKDKNSECVSKCNNKLTVSELWVDSGVNLVAIGESLEKKATEDNGFEGVLSLIDHIRSSLMG